MGKYKTTSEPFFCPFHFAFIKEGYKEIVQASYVLATMLQWIVRKLGFPRRRFPREWWLRVTSSPIYDSQGLSPITWQLLLVLSIISAGLGFLTLCHIVPVFSSGSCVFYSLSFWVAVLVAFIWIDTLLASICTFLFVESVRWVFSHFGHPQSRADPWIRPLITGIVERMLFTVPSIILLLPRGPDHEAEIGALAAIAAGYVGVKGLFWQRDSDKPKSVSIQSLWGTAVSLSFAIFAGWLFVQIRSNW
jgi:hypothetical protein